MFGQSETDPYYNRFAKEKLDPKKIENSKNNNFEKIKYLF